MVVAFPIVAAGIWLINYGLPAVWHAVLTHHILRNPVHLPHSLAWLGTYLSGFPWQPLVIGILAGLVVHRVYAPAGQHGPAVLHRPLGGPEPGTRPPPARRIRSGTCPAGPGRR